jgi:hypothetical protein
LEHFAAGDLRREKRERYKFPDDLFGCVHRPASLRLSTRRFSKKMIISFSEILILLPIR